jgi:hypothetical protein
VRTIFDGLVIGLGVGVGTLIEAALLYLVVFTETTAETPWLGRTLRTVGLATLVVGAAGVSVVLAGLCGMALVSLGRSLAP